MTISQIANNAANASENSCSDLKYVWFRAAAGDDTSYKSYKFIDAMDNAAENSGAKNVGITVPYVPNPELVQKVAVVYAMFRGEFNEKQRGILESAGMEIDKATYYSDNALLSHLNGYNDEVDTTIDFNERPSSFGAFDNCNLQKYILRDHQMDLLNLHMLDKPDSLVMN